MKFLRIKQKYNCSELFEPTAIAGEEAGTGVAGKKPLTNLDIAPASTF